MITDIRKRIRPQTIYRIDIKESAELDMPEEITHITVQLHDWMTADRLLDEATEAINRLEEETPLRHPLVDDKNLEYL